MRPGPTLSLLNPRSYVAGGFDASGDWALQFHRAEGIKCYAVVKGQCWLAVEDVDEPVLLKTGDCFLLPRGRAFRIASDLSLPPVEALDLLHRRRVGGIGIINDGGECMIVGGHFVFSGKHTGVLLEALPPIAHIHKDADREALRWSLQRLSMELREQPQHVGMSRSTLALKFKQTVGASPMEYLTRWRMLLAGDRLGHTSQPVSVISQALGYESDSAFSTAFKRVMGCSPRQYVRDQAL
ncbi:AraC family transcriptional regulator [Duganella sp. BuS-21]|uniref:AraC family transcriptional regulator n=1 Tax=Duganella sp. BuS-21 TaxID=2943848 RepID=UPI0035A60577